MQRNKKKINKFVLRNFYDLFDIIALDWYIDYRLSYYLSTLFDDNNKWANIIIEFDKEFSVEYYDGENEHKFVVKNSELEYKFNGNLHDISELNDLLNPEDLEYMEFFNNLHKYLYNIELFNLNILNVSIDA